MMNRMRREEKGMWTRRGFKAKRCQERVMTGKDVPRKMVWRETYAKHNWWQKLEMSKEDLKNERCQGARDVKRTWWHKQVITKDRSEENIQEKTAWRERASMSRRCQEKRIQRARDVKKNEKEISRATDNKRKGLKRISRDAKEMLFQHASGLPHKLWANYFFASSFFFSLRLARALLVSGTPRLFPTHHWISIGCNRVSLFLSVHNLQHWQVQVR